MNELVNDTDANIATLPDGEPPAQEHCGCAEAVPATGGLQAASAAAAVAALAEVEDPLARAAAATRLLVVLDAERLEVVRLRREAVAAARPVSVRRLAGVLGLSVTAASDLLRGAAGQPRRLARDVKPGRARAAATPPKGVESVSGEGSDQPE